MKRVILILAGLFPLAAMAAWRTGPDNMLGSVPASGYVQNFSEGLALWINAQQALYQNPAATNGQSVPIYDYSGHNWAISQGFGSSAVTLSKNGIGGQPAFYFNGSADLVVPGIMPGITNLTIEVTYQNPTSAGNMFIWSAGSTNASSSAATEMWSLIYNSGQTAGEGGNFAGGEVLYTGAHGGVVQRLGAPHVAVYNFDGSREWMSLDGMIVHDGRIQDDGNLVGRWNGCTNFLVGSDTGTQYGGKYFKGYVSDLRIYTNSLTDTFRQALERFCCQQAGLPVNAIDVEGDSISQGLHTWSFMGGYQQILAPMFPGYLVNTLAYSGRTAAEEVTNAASLAPLRRSGNNFVSLLIGVNDFSGGVGVQTASTVAATLLNVSNIISVWESNGIPVAIGTITSCLWETNSLVANGYDWRANFNTGIRAMTNIGAYVMDFAGDIPDMGTNGAYANTNWTLAWTPFNSDEVHPNSVGYTNMSQVALPVWNYLAYGSTSEEVPTNIPPFSWTLPLTDTYQGHIYYAVGNVWTLVK